MTDRRPLWHSRPGIPTCSRWRNRMRRSRSTSWHHSVLASSGHLSPPGLKNRHTQKRKKYYIFPGISEVIEIAAASLVGSWKLLAASKFYWLSSSSHSSKHYRLHKHRYSGQLLHWMTLIYYFFSLVFLAKFHKQTQIMPRTFKIWNATMCKFAQLCTSVLTPSEEETAPA